MCVRGRGGRLLPVRVAAQQEARQLVEQGGGLGVMDAA